MQYMRFTDTERGELMAALAGMKDYLRESFASLTPEEARVPPPCGGFSPVDYRSLSLATRLKAFEAARAANIAALLSVAPESWTRSGTQEGVGEVSLCDMPTFLHQHDQAHVAEIQERKKHAGRRDG